MSYENIRHSITGGYIGNIKYGYFRKYAINADGTSVSFLYPNGIEYTVATDFIYSWYSMTNLIILNNKLVQLNESMPLKRPAPNKLCATNIFGLSGVYNRRKQWVCIYFNTGVAIDVECDHPLAHCEPCYDDYGWAGNTLHDYAQLNPVLPSPCSVGYRDDLVTQRNGWRFKNILFNEFDSFCQVSFQTEDTYRFRQDAIDYLLPDIEKIPRVRCRMGKRRISCWRVPLEQISIRRKLNRLDVIRGFLHKADYRFKNIENREVGK